MKLKNYIVNFSLIVAGSISCIPASANQAQPGISVKKTTTPTSTNSSNISWNDAYGKVYYSINSLPSPIVKLALEMFSNDMKMVLGHSAKEKSNANIQIFQLDQLTNKEFAALEKLNTPIHQFITQKDAFWIGTRNGKMIVVGSDARGTAYGILELSKMAGVSPWNDYLHLQPAQRQSIAVKPGMESLQIPAVDYRGFLLNHSSWMKNSNDKAICQLMLRLKANVLWIDDNQEHIDFDKNLLENYDILVAEDNKVTEMVMGKKRGKGHKKHKKAINHVKIVWDNNQLSFNSTSPGLLLTELSNDLLHTHSKEHASKKHKEHGNHHNEEEAWVANVTDPTTTAYQTSMFMDMAWNKQAIQANTLERHLTNWLTQAFGNKTATSLLPILKEYYRLTSIRPTDHMAMPYGEMEFHSGEFCNELEHYLFDYDLLKSKVSQLEQTIPTTQKEGFVKTIKTPIYIAALTAEKELEAQEARHIARPGLFQQDDEAKAAAALSLKAYQQLKTLDPTAQPPTLPGKLTPDEMKLALQDAFDRTEDLQPLTYAQMKYYNCKNAYKFDKVSQTVTTDEKSENKQPAYTLIPFLGHSQKAVLLAKGTTLKYSVETDASGDARFTIASIPDYTNELGDMKVSVSIDQTEPVVISLKNKYNQRDWKLDIWRGQTLKNFFVTLSEGYHTIEIKALDDNIILDQWALDFDVDREYYIIPAKK